MNIFISGKVTGDNLANVKFLNASLTLENLFGRRAHIISPTDIDLNGMSWEDCMDITVTILKHCDTVVFLPDWKDSKGARQEHEYAVNNGKKILYYQDLLNKNLRKARENE